MSRRARQFFRGTQRRTTYPCGVTELRFGRFVALGVAIHALGLAWLVCASVPRVAPSAQEVQAAWQQLSFVEVEAEPTTESALVSLPQVNESRLASSVGSRAAATRTPTARSALPTQSEATLSAGSAAPPPAPVAPEGASATAPSASAIATEAVAPHLNLAQMGVGQASPWLWPEGTVYPKGQADAPEASNESRDALAERRVERNLAAGLNEQDQAKGTSSASWLTSTLTQAAMGTAPPRSTARFSILTDPRGLVLSVDLVDANGDAEAWKAVGSRALAELRGRQRSNPSGHPIRTLVEVVSRVKLPSGRSPGMGVSLLNLPLKRREHEDSPNIALLSLKPKLQVGEVLDPTRSGGETTKLPYIMPQVELVNINGDLVDIGAAGRQVVQSKIVREELL